MHRLPIEVYNEAQRYKTELGLTLLVRGPLLDYVLEETDDRPDTWSVLVIGDRDDAIADIKSHTGAGDKPLNLEWAYDDELTVRCVHGLPVNYWFYDSIEDFLVNASNPRAYDPIRRLLYEAIDFPRDGETQPVGVSVDGEPTFAVQVVPGTPPTDIRVQVENEFRAEHVKSNGVFKLETEGGAWYVKVLDAPVPEAEPAPPPAPEPVREREYTGRWYARRESVTAKVPVGADIHATLADALVAAGHKPWKNSSGRVANTVVAWPAGEHEGSHNSLSADVVVPVAPPPAPPAPPARPDAHVPVVRPK